VFAKVREKARQTSCLSNEKQLGLAFVQYVEDYDEILPWGINYRVQTPEGAGWAGQICNGLSYYCEACGTDDLSSNNYQVTFSPI